MDAENKFALGTTAMASIPGGAEAAAISAAVPASLVAALQAITLVPDANGQIILPTGIQLDDIRVAGRDLIITMPDGTQLIIPDGAIFVPQFVLDGIAVPPLNIAALLIGQETAPAAGQPTSSGGNFADPVGDIGDPFARGDLLPPTLLLFPEAEEPDFIPESPDEEPTTIIITPDQPAGSVSATAAVGEAGLPARGSEPAGSNEAGNDETTTGSIIFDAPDGLGSINLNGVAITAVGQIFTTPLGQLTITSIAAGNIGYSYTLLDNSVNPSATDIFAVVVVDNDGDTATADLTITINDDTPTARNDTDFVPAANFTAQTGNVITGAGTSSGAAGADSQGADGAAVTGARAGTSGAFAAVGSTINGAFGVLTLNADGSYSYARNPGTPGGVTDSFSYQITDGDGDMSAATLVISIGDSPATVLSVPSTGGGTVVDEEGLPPRGFEPPGSNEAAPIETTAGTITFVAPDGIASVQVNGVTITGPGQVISTPTGIFAVTAFNPAAGTLDYTFTLTDNTSGDSTAQTVTVTVTDTDGDSDSETFPITIIDDAPIARGDSGSQDTENAPITVNVIGNDTPGADGVNLTSGVAAVAGSLSGTGTLAYNGDGNFTYTPAAGEEGIVTFQYTITDGDGDISAATVTINLAEDSVPLVDVSGDNDADEAGLPARGSEPAGSDAAANSEIAIGTIIAATGADSIASLVINGVNVTAGGTVTSASGILAITLSAGVYSYSYTLTDNRLGDTTADSFNVVLTDSDGDVANDTLVIAIIDDVPAAANDANSIAAGTFGPVTGNVVANDVLGADGASVTAVNAGLTVGSTGTALQGVYGVLTLNADGSYSYTRDAATPGGVSDVFTYTITDGDGDTASATLTISIADSPTSLDLPATGEAGTQVDENGLPAGSNAAASSEITNGVIAYTAPDGPAIVTIEGVAITLVGQIIAGASGSLRITSIAPGAIGYEYTLTTNTLGDATFDDFAVVVTDQDGDSTAGTLVIDIIDDVPTANDDTDFVASGSLLPATGNVITDAENVGGRDTQGADGAIVTAVAGGIVGGATAGTYGVLTLNADGSYSYIRNDGSPGNVSDIFTYTITDGDGDTDTATLTITIEDARPITGDNPAVLLDDDALAGGNAGGTGDDAEPANVSGNLAGSGGDGALTWALAGTGAPSGFNYVANGTGIDIFQGATLVLQVTLVAATGAYAVTQLAPIVHAAGNDENNQFFTVDYTVTDADGDIANGTLSINVDDDTPVAVSDINSVIEGAVVTGNVLTDGASDSFGADGAIVTAPIGGVVGVAAGSNIAVPVSGGLGAPIVTTLGSLTLNADGSYSYDALPNTTADVITDSFVYTIVDRDGDPSTATLTITINPVTLVADNDSITVDEAALNIIGSNPGSNAETSGGTLAVAGAAGYTLVGSGAGTFGTLTLNANGSYSYTLTTPVDGADANNGTNTEIGRDLFTYTATDANGNMVNGQIAIDIIDDVPTARDDSAGLTEGGPISASFDVDSNDTPGADGTASRIFTALTGTYGNLTLNGDGTQTYTLNAVGQAAIDALAPGAVLLDVFTYTLTDGDGDSDPATLTVTLTGSDDPPLISNLTPLANGGDAVVDEDDLPAGSDNSPESLTTTGNFTITAPDGVDDLTVGGVQVIVNGVFAAPAALITPLGNILTFTGYNAATGVVSYSYTLTGAETHANANGENDLFENFAVVLTDTDNDVATDMLSLRIVDDVPTANDDSIMQTAENAPVTVDVIANDTRGADGVNLATGVAAVGGTLTGAGGLVYNGNGTFTYTPAPGETGSVTFQYRITDADGDSDPATVTITLAADSVPAVVNVTAAVDDDGLLGGNPASTAGDIDADIGDSGAGLGNEAVFVGQINVNFGGDTGTVSFANLNGTSAMVGMEMVTFDWNAGTNILTATGPRGALFTVNLTPSGGYRVTLLDNVLHAPGGNEASAPALNLNYLATDSDGDTNSTGVLAITFNDDTPVAIAPLAITLANAAGAAGSALLDTDGNIDNNAGADQFGLVTIPSSLQGATTLTSNGQVIYYFVAAGGQTLTATTDSSGIADASRWVFTVEINQDFDAALGNDRYEVTLFGTVDSTESINFEPGTFDFLGGNTHWVGFVPLGQEDAPINDGSQDLLITPIANGDTANGNANEVGSGGAGGGSLAIGPNQGLRLDFVNDLLGNPASGGGGYQGPSNHSFDGHYQVTGATIRFGVGGNANNTTTVRLIAFDDNDSGNVNQVGNGTQDPITRIVITYNTDTVSTADDVVFTVDTSTPGTDMISFGGNSFTVTREASGAVTFNGVQDGVSIGVFTANAFTTLEARYVAGTEFTLTGFGTTAITNEPVNLSIPVQFQDADGDIAASSNLAITLNPATPPIVLDLDGDGAEFLSQSAGVTFDYQGDGSPESTAWVGADDGLLVIDLNGDGIVSNGSEIIFGRDGQTDLQGLAASYDSDGNNILDAADAAFARFGVWQDANSNGVTDEGEFRSLSDAGITNISLQSDGLRYSAANGDVVVQGEAAFVRADGSAGIAADASFAVGSAQIQQREQANSNALVAASLIALAGADVAAQDAAFAAVRDGLEIREIDVDSASALPIITEPATDAAATLQHSEYLPEVKTADPLPLDTIPITQLWDTTGLAQQEIPVVQYAPAQTGNVVQLPSSGAPILSQSIPTGLIDALLLVGDAQPGLDEPENPALQAVIADTLNDNSIDDLLDRLTGPAGESFAGEQSAVPGDNADLASNLINMPVASNVVTLITGMGVSDQLQDMAANQG